MHRLHYLLLTTLFALLAVPCAAPAGPSGAEGQQAWDARAATLELEQPAYVIDRAARLHELYLRLRVGDTGGVLSLLSALASHADWSGPQRDAAAFSFTQGLHGLGPVALTEPGLEAVLDWLRAWEPQTLVPDLEHSGQLQPWLNVRGAASGVRNAGLRAAATARGRTALEMDPTIFVEVWQQAQLWPTRQGLLESIEAAPAAQLVELEDWLQLLPRPSVAQAELAAWIAVFRGRGADSTESALLALQTVATPFRAALLRSIAASWPATRQAELLAGLLHSAPADFGALALAILGPAAVRGGFALPDPDSFKQSALATTTRLLHQRLVAEQANTLQRAPDVPSTTATTAARIVEWVESNPGQDPNRIALGYPPPIPLDTPLPYDGFRTWAGLHARHQDLANSTPWVHSHAVGTTHQGIPIQAYRLGDADYTTPWGLPEAATLTNGGIHAREWQTPEVVTGILELLATRPADLHFYDFLREHVNMIVVPVLNIDGFRQTQRYPTRNWLGTDPDDPVLSPRDGRMRRKNMPGVDDSLDTLDDHLLGVDLNRNNSPYWNSTGGQASSGDPESLVYHGAFAGSEPEIQALDAAAQLGPAAALSLYTDVHSFSLVLYWSRNANEILTRQTETILNLFADHHRAFPAGKWYAHSDRTGVPLSQGIGATDEYFLDAYGVPAFGVEVEPSDGQPWHQPLAGGGGDYGGLHVNGHDGFILPDSQVRRVREQLAETFVAIYYRQAGPPHLQALRITEPDTQAVVYDAEWDLRPDGQREAVIYQEQPLALGRPYQIWLAFSKPMRDLQAGVAQPLQGLSARTFPMRFRARSAAGAIEFTSAGDWVTQAAGAEAWEAPHGRLRYTTDAYWMDLEFSASAANREKLAGPTTVELETWVSDMTGLGLDAHPATPARWGEGRWLGFEAASGAPTSVGGPDSSFSVLLSDAEPDPAVLPAFLPEPGISAAWFDPTHDGEGFLIEILPDQRALLYWFTYDDVGGQDWYLAVGELRGNRLLFPELLRYSGGRFGPDYNPAQVRSSPVGSARFTFTGCDTGRMDWHQGNRRGRQDLQRITRIMGLDCGPQMGAPISQQAQYSGSWYDPSHDGEGYVVEVLQQGGALVYWFSYDSQGARRWFFGLGQFEGDRLRITRLATTRGGRFGPAFDPDAVVTEDWGLLELNLTCAGGTADYSSPVPGFGSGQLQLRKLTNLDGPGC